MKKTQVLMAFSALSLFAMEARGIVVDLIPQAVAAYDTSFDPAPLPRSLWCCTDEIIIQFDFSISVSDLQPGEAGFGSISFDINFFNPFGGVSISDAFELGWQPDSEIIDINGPAPGGILPRWSINEDLGTPNDEKDILVAVATRMFSPSDPRNTLGQGAPQYIGSLFVHWMPGTGFLTTENILYSAKSTTGVLLPPVTGMGRVIGISNICPEPGSLTLVVMGMGMVLWRRH